MADMTSMEALSPPPPWTLKGTVFILPFWVLRNSALPALAMHPLEAASSFASPASGRPAGGFSTVWIVRYAESPVGPYDEMIIQPGYFDFEMEGADGRRRQQRKCRITRIYVSRKESCYSGRKHWNICKHLARFEFDDRPDGSTSVAVFPHDTVTPYVEGEPSPATDPFFRSTFAPARFVPSFPLSLGVSRYIGLDLELVMPPLPPGNGSQGELPGTDEWCAISSDVSSPRASVGWFDMRQGGSDGGGPEGAGAESNFWPGWKRWMIGTRLENATVKFDAGRKWKTGNTME